MKTVSLMQAQAILGIQPRKIKGETVTSRKSVYRLNENVVDRIWLERLRQMELLKSGKHKYTCATAGIEPEFKLCVLMEEVGEVARALDQMRNHPPAKSSADFKQKFIARKEHLRDELTHVAAVTVAWLEALEEELK